jgi:hypothetical protein
MERALNTILTKESLCNKFIYSEGALFRKNSGKRAGTVNSTGRRQISIGKKLYKEHRLIFLMHHGFLPKEIDHIDGNPLNNKIDNLREASRTQNNANQKIRKDNSSGAKGISWVKSRNQWVAYSCINGKKKYAGYYKDLNAAITAVKELRKAQYGAFTNHG